MLRTLILLACLSLLAACPQKGPTEESPSVTPSAATSEASEAAPQPPGCEVAGCSRHLCLPAGEAEGLMSTCEWQDEYECRQLAICERQPNGQCGFTETAESKACTEKLTKNAPSL